MTPIRKLMLASMAKQLPRESVITALGEIAPSGMALCLLTIPFAFACFWRLVPILLESFAVTGKLAGA